MKTLGLEWKHTIHMLVRSMIWNTGFRLVSFPI